MEHHNMSTVHIKVSQVHFNKKSIWMQVNFYQSQQIEHLESAHQSKTDLIKHHKGKINNPVFTFAELYNNVFRLFGTRKKSKKKLGDPMHFCSYRLIKMYECLVIVTCRTGVDTLWEVRKATIITITIVII